MILALIVIGSATHASAAIVLSSTQQATVLAEADAAYSQGIKKSKTDSADAKELFATAMSKYQLLVDSGVRNVDLFINLGNASIQSGELGYAIANYEKALRLEPSNTQANKNLAFADKRISGTAQADRPNSRWIPTLSKGLRPAAKWMLGIASVVFWGFIMLRLVRRSFPVWKLAAVPLVLMLLLGSVLLRSSSQRGSTFNAVIVANNVRLHAGDGEQFDSVMTIEEAVGHRVEQLVKRGDWSQIKTSDGHMGWIHSRDIVLVVIS